MEVLKEPQQQSYFQNWGAGTQLNLRLYSSPLISNKNSISSFFSLPSRFLWFPDQLVFIIDTKDILFICGGAFVVLEKTISESSKVVWKRRIFLTIAGLGKPAEATHVAGSISHAEVFERLTTILGRNPTPHELFAFTNTKRHDGTSWTNPRAQAVGEEYVIEKQNDLEVQMKDQIGSLQIAIGRFELELDEIRGSRAHRSSSSRVESDDEIDLT